MITNATQIVSGTNSPISVDWAQLLNVRFKEGGLHIAVGPALLFLGGVTVVWLTWQFWRRLPAFSNYEIVEATLKVADVGEIKIKPNNDIIRIAYQAWVELTTRKLALPFDEHHDVIAEIYASFYDAFGKLRELAKTVPAIQLRSSKDTRDLVNIMEKVLNKGLRPHLTVWQAKFKRWYNAELTKSNNSEKTPQEIQRTYPHYNALIDDLKILHGQVSEYADFLKRLAHGDKE